MTEIVADRSTLQPRPDIEYDVHDVAQIGTIRQNIGFLETLFNITAVRRALVLAGLCLIWEIYARYLGNPLMFPSFGETVTTLWGDILSGRLPSAAITSLQVLVTGYAAAIALASVMTTLAISTRFGTDLLATLTAMFNPLPAIAVLPLALLWFGLGTSSIVFVIVHSVLWAVSLNTFSGFLAVSQTQRMAGRNYGLGGLRMVFFILIPAAFPSILAGLKIGWAFAWRTLIAAELVFGVSGNAAGLGWYIFEARNALETSGVFAGLLTVIVIGLVVEGLVFRTIEVLTVRKWGTQHG